MRAALSIIIIISMRHHRDRHHHHRHQPQHRHHHHRQCVAAGAVRSISSHFGLYPFSWKQDWQLAAQTLIGEDAPRLQIAPVVERLVMPRAKALMLSWLDGLLEQQALRWLVPAHYSAPLPFGASEVKALRLNITSRGWAPSYGDWSFLGSFDSALLKFGVVPDDPLESFRD